jgi:hypothetical protein
VLACSHIVTQLHSETRANLRRTLVGSQTCLSDTTIEILQVYMLHITGVLRMSRLAEGWVDSEHQPLFLEISKTAATHTATQTLLSSHHKLQSGPTTQKRTSSLFIFCLGTCLQANTRSLMFEAVSLNRASHKRTRLDILKFVSDKRKRTLQLTHNMHPTT